MVTGKFYTSHWCLEFAAELKMLTPIQRETRNLITTDDLAQLLINQTPRLKDLKSDEVHTKEFLDDVVLSIAVESTRQLAELSLNASVSGGDEFVPSGVYVAVGAEARDKLKNYTASVDLVVQFYDRLLAADAITLKSLVSDEIEWRFHGPRLSNKYMMKLLTGEKRIGSVSFVPDHIHRIDSTRAAAQGQGWLHVWTVNIDTGKLTHLSEYCNTIIEFGRGDSTLVLGQSSDVEKSFPVLVIPTMYKEPQKLTAVSIAFGFFAFSAH
ncbi:uncharacterized protein LOC9651038 [Selaginella moellendorffii]|uniref:uncharacterized protein LOC9651038 n=1 Tax=Selaginella moellendorffii TaxID=88036 RepID=UPI000D1CEAC6|nr:uncharacterized protein LOC9651038 [Selaginella moellendorffii]|eukprot:XP_024533197.1 uncharacterized protein LOC9651038 [Selaginella moellendorffii]